MSDQTTVNDTTPVVEMTQMEFFDSLTGYEEHAIRKAWDGAVMTKLGKENPSQWVRCLVFIHFKREQRPDPQRLALDLTLGALKTFFAPDPDEKEPAQVMQAALAAVLEAESLETAHAAARRALEGQEAGGAPGEAK